MNEIDDSKRFFNELYKLRVDLIKETFEILGDDYNITNPNVTYHNYLDSSTTTMDGNIYGNDNLTSNPDWINFNKQFEEYTGSGQFNAEKIFEIFKKKGAIKAYVCAVIKAFDLYGDKVGLTDKGKIIMLGQFAHESGCFKYVKEIGGEKAIYGQPTGPYNKRYYGRGPIQITHLQNYKIITEKYFPKLGCNYDIYRNPDLCEQNLEIGAAASMAWMLIPNNGPMAVKYANAGDIKMCTRMINGGYNGLEERMNLTKLIMNTLS